MPLAQKYEPVYAAAHCFTPSHDNKFLIILGSLTPPYHSPRVEWVFRVSLQSFWEREGGFGSTREVLAAKYVWSEAVIPFAGTFALEKMTMIGANLLLFSTSDHRFFWLPFVIGTIALKC